MKKTLLTRLAKISLASGFLAIRSNGWAAIDLGQASPYALFQLGGGGNFKTADTFIQGDVAFGPGNYNASLGHLAVNGNVFDSGSRTVIQPSNLHSEDATTSPGQNSGLVPFSGQVFHNANLNQAVADAVAASAAANALCADFKLGNVRGSQTINLDSVTPMTPGVYVIDATGLTLHNGALVLDGAGIPANAQVIINDSGQFTLNGGSSISLTGGLTVSHVLVNDTSTQAAKITGNSTLFGSFLGPNLNAQFTSDAAAVYGQVIAQSIQFSSHFSVDGELFVPEPATFMAGALLLLPLGAWSWRMLRKRA